MTIILPHVYCPFSSVLVSGSSKGISSLLLNNITEETGKAVHIQESPSLGKQEPSERKLFVSH